MTNTNLTTTSNKTVRVFRSAEAYAQYAERRYDEGHDPVFPKNTGNLTYAAGYRQYDGFFTAGTEKEALEKLAGIFDIRKIERGAESDLEITEIDDGLYYVIYQEREA